MHGAQCGSLCPAQQTAMCASAWQARVWRVPCAGPSKTKEGQAIHPLAHSLTGAVPCMIGVSRSAPAVHQQWWHAAGQGRALLSRHVQGAPVFFLLTLIMKAQKLMFRSMPRADRSMNVWVV